MLSNETPLPTPTPFTYIVEAGDTLSKIAEQFSVPLDDLQAANPEISPSSMAVGSVLQIPSGPQNPTGESTPTPVPVIVKEIECHPSVEGGLWCFVPVHNDYPDFMENLSAQVTLVDVNGQTIASQTALLPLNLLPPNTSLPLSVFFAPEIPADVQPRAQILTAMRLSPDDERYLPATLQNILAEIDWSGHSAQVSGQVALPATSKAASQVWVAAVAYDESDSVAGIRRWESNTGFPAGNSLPFKFTIYSVAGEIERVELAVEARP